MNGEIYYQSTKLSVIMFSSDNGKISKTLNTSSKYKYIKIIDTLMSMKFNFS